MAEDQELDFYWDGTQVFYYDEEKGLVETGDMYRIFKNLSDAREQGNLLEHGSITMCTEDFANKLLERLSFSENGDDFLGLNISQLHDAFLQESAVLRRKAFANMIADKDGFEAEYLALIEEMYKSGIIGAQKLLSYIPETDDGFHLLERTVLAGTA